MNNMVPLSLGFEPQYGSNSPTQIQYTVYTRFIKVIEKLASIKKQCHNHTLTPCGRNTQHLQSDDIKETIKVKSGKFGYHVNSDTHLQTV